MSNQITVNPYEVMFIIHRDRDPAEFKQIKESVRQMGVMIPIQVRDITSWPTDRRRRDDGGLYKWQAFFGQGRCTACIELYESTKDDSFLKVPATVETQPESEIAGRFLTENLLRNPLSWQEQAQLIRGDIESLGKIDKRSIATVAKAYFVSPAHVLKLLRTLQKLSPEVEKELSGMTIADAEKLSSLPATGQEIVMSTLKEEGLDKGQVAALVRRAKRITEEGTPLSKSALKQSLQRLNEELSRARQSAKPLRLHYAIGPENLTAMLDNPKLRKAFDDEGINTKKFEEAVNQ